MGFLRAMAAWQSQAGAPAPAPRERGRLR